MLFQPLRRDVSSVQEDCQGGRNRLPEMNVEIIIYYNIFIVDAGREAKHHIVTYRGLQSRRMVITIRFSPPAGMVPAPRGSYPHGAGIPT